MDKAAQREQLEKELEKLRPQYCELSTKYLRSRGKQRKEAELPYREMGDRMTAILWEIASLREDYI